MTKSVYTIRVDKKMREEFSRRCIAEGIGVSAALEALMKAYLDGTVKLKSDIQVIKEEA